MKITPECKELLQAISEIQKDIVPPAKDAKSDMYGGYDYATLGEVISQIEGVARSHGVVINQSIDYFYKDEDPYNGLDTLHTVVTHLKTGQQLTAVCRLPYENRSPHAVVGASTYMRRCELLCIFFVAPEDDDAASAQVSPRRSTPARRPKVAESEEPSSPSGKSDSAAGLTAEYVIRELSEAWGPTVEVKVEKYRDFMNNSMTPAEKQKCRTILDRKEEANKK